MAIPLFILAGNLLNASGLTPKLMMFSRSLVGHFRGGIGYVNVVSSVFFSGVNGSAVADTSALGTLLVPAMRKEGYSSEFAACLTAGSSLIGPLVPPSIFMIIYASMTNTAVGDLFLAGIVPGIVLGSVFLIVNWRYARENNIRSHDKKPALRVIVKTGFQALPAIFAPILIVSSIVFGVVTPTESGVLIVFYAIVVGFVLKTLKLRCIYVAVVDAAKLSAAIFAIIASSSVLTWLLAYAEVPATFAKLLFPFAEDPILILFVLSAIAFFAGMFMEEVSALMLLTPIFVPVASLAGVDQFTWGWWLQ